MRSIRGLALALVVPLLMPATTSAQSGRLFRDSWFWGAKAGGMLFSTPTVTNKVAPSGGADWVITRSRGGLYVSLDHSFFTETSEVPDELTIEGRRSVEMSDMNRLSIAGLGFPGQLGRFRPYFGLGFALSVIGTAEPQGTFQSAPQQALIEARIEDRRSQASLLALIGTQMELRRFSLFAQATGLPYSGLLFTDGSAWSVEAGIRYNIGNSIEQINRGGER